MSRGDRIFFRIQVMLALEFAMKLALFMLVGEMK
jgi:hypothetical protein